MPRSALSHRKARTPAQRVAIPELLDLIFDHADRPTRAICMRVSKCFYDVVVAQLYEKIELDSEKGADPFIGLDVTTTKSRTTRSGGRALPLKADALRHTRELTIQSYVREDMWEVPNSSCLENIRVVKICLSGRIILNPVYRTLPRHGLPIEKIVIRCDSSGDLQAIAEFKWTECSRLKKIVISPARLTIGFNLFRSAPCTYFQAHPTSILILFRSLPGQFFHPVVLGRHSLEDSGTRLVREIAWLAVKGFESTTICNIGSCNPRFLDRKSCSNLDNQRVIEAAVRQTLEDNTGSRYGRTVEERKRESEKLHFITMEEYLERNEWEGELEEEVARPWLEFIEAEKAKVLACGKGKNKPE